MSHIVNAHISKPKIRKRGHVKVLRTKPLCALVLTHDHKDKKETMA